MRSIQTITTMGVLILLSSCGGNTGTTTSLSTLFDGAASAIAPVVESIVQSTSEKISISPLAITASAPVSYYAASRFLEQASWGPTPQSIADVQSMGMSAWIDQQLFSLLHSPTHPTM